jgi:hypothetical protein
MIIMSLFSLTPVGIIEERARKLVSEKYPRLLDQISYEVSSSIPSEAESMITEDEIVDGAYDAETKTIYLHRDSTLKSALHEIGHAIHYQLYNAEVFNLPLEKKSNRACVNFKEDFAEAFAELITGEGSKKRNNEMTRILKSL